MTTRQPFGACPICADYIQRRRAVLLPFIGRWVARQDRLRPPAILVEQILDTHHHNVCLHQIEIEVPA